MHQQKHQGKVSILSKVNNKDTRMTSTDVKLLDLMVTLDRSDIFLLFLLLRFDS